MFKLIILVLFLSNGVPQQFEGERIERFETLADCMAEAATLAMQPDIIAMQAVCVPVGSDEHEA
jgi:hypothetical protein